VTKILGILIDRKMWERFLNQSCQYFYVYFKFTFQPHFLTPLCSISLSWGGIDILADSTLRRVVDWILHLIAAYWLSKCLGLSLRIWFINGRASIAVPSTTSIIIIPTILSSFYLFVKISVTLAQTEPPSECPINTKFLFGCFCICSFKISIVSLTKV